MATATKNPTPQESEICARRREAMAVLASSTAAEIAHHLAEIAPVPTHAELRAPQSGLVMLRGRIGGDGAPFNVGEATVSRASIRLASGEIGTGYVLGRDHDKCRLLALCDALIQTDDYRHAVERHVLAPIRKRLAAARDRAAQQAAATKVEFFTLVRGEDQ